MKKLFYLGLVSLFSFSLNAQTEQCATMEMLQEFHDQNPGMAEQFQKDILNENKTVVPSRKSNHKKIIPVVVHVIHYNGVGNISKAQIEDGIRIMNEDFNKLNADTSTQRAVFQNLSVSADIEFRLAQRDPTGNCTEGITRTNSYMTLGTPNRNQPKSLIQWDPFKYLNVWLVSAFDQANLLGFAQFPAPSGGPLSTYGMVVRSSEWGSIGTATNNFGFGRTPTHEAGHCFELFHPFQSGCGSFCQGSGDLVCDTPPQVDARGNRCFSGSGAASPASSCSNDTQGGNTLNPNPFTTNVPDQLENFMGYGDGCMSMFTQGQKDRMDRAFANYNQLINMIDTANLTATGTSDSYTAPPCVPIAEVLDFDKFLCRGSSVQFFENSYGGPITTYNWSFPGGTPSSSNLASPTITYNTPGNYDVILRVGNASGVDSLVLSSFVHVGDTQATYSGFNYVESFENATSFANDWVTVSPSGAPEWDRAAFAGKTGTASIWVNNLNNVFDGGIDRIVSPSINMADVLSPSISMEVAYRRRTSNSNDRLTLLASLDCGRNWLNILTATPSFFAFDNSTQTGNFFPSQGSQWRNLTIPTQFIPVSVRNSRNVKFMLELVNGDGNNIYVDDFAILGQPVGIKDNKKAEVANFNMYPNPAKENVNLSYTPRSSSDQVKIYVTNVIGERILKVYEGSMTAKEYKFQINTADLSKGIYFVSVEGQEERITRKLVIH